MFDNDSVHLVWFVLLKTIHITSLIFWLGPSLGAWWLLRSTTHRFGEPSITSQFLYQMFFKVAGIEHLALVTLLASGLSMGLITHGFAQNWLLLKLSLVAVIVIPLEAIDIWFCHYKLPRLFQQRHPARPYAVQESQLLAMYHTRFVPLALICLPLAVISIFWLAIAKPII
jgi:uncharacterized membrane protein